jgi:superfamily II DNA or RNA helicase
MEEKTSKYLDNVQSLVVDDLKNTIKEGSRISIVAASFSMYAFQSLKKELSEIEDFRFIFTDNSFVKEKEQKKVREFYIPPLNGERSLYGNDFEIKLRNELNLQAIARECADWIKGKVKFKSNLSKEFMQPFLVVETGQDVAVYNPFKEFTTAELGEDKGNNAYSVTMKLYAPVSRQLLDNFNALWTDHDKLEDVTETVLENITNAYKENSPELIYYLALYNIFNEFLQDINQDFLPNEKTGFKDSKIWNMLYNFQRDAVMGCISKLEKHNGCILADSVGLGKTFSALGVIKYYELRNKNVLVLCPKRLASNWNTFNNPYDDNPIIEDRLHYCVLFHTDLQRDRGESNGFELDRLNWSNYDLLVIDESHNFRNGEHTTHKKDDEYENRYQKLLSKVVKHGVKTKVLMLSATPVNTDFYDLKNQLMLAAEGYSGYLSETLDTEGSVDSIFSQAQKAFKEWADLEIEERTTGKLISMLHFDFFKLLDSVTIARSRKHIERYYSDVNIGKFPTRLTPISLRPELTDIENVDYNTLFGYIDELNLDIYNPLNYVYPSKLGRYVDLDTLSGKSWKNREKGRNMLMIINLLKRAESSIYAFRLSSSRLLDLIDTTIDHIDRFEQDGRANHKIEVEQWNEMEDEAEDFFVGKDLKIDLADMDYVSWRESLTEDGAVLRELLHSIAPVTPEHDLKLRELRKEMRKKFANPINLGNKKVLVFTAFADTANYLYNSLSDILLEEHRIHSALVTGMQNLTNLKGIHADFNEILTYFSPKSKNREALNKSVLGDIDVVFATDCISEGQNLQDCDYLINYDIHWNPVRIIQRFGRIDRIGSQNSTIQLVNFWPNITLDEYINLKARVENRMKLVGTTTAGEDVLDNVDTDLVYRKRQLERLQEEVVDIEDMDSGISIMDLGLNEFHLDVQELLKKYGNADLLPHGIHAVAKADNEHLNGVIFVLKNINPSINVDKQNRLHPFYLVYVGDHGETLVDHLNPKMLLDKFRYLCKNNDKPLKKLVAEFNRETGDGRHMKTYSDLLGKAISSIVDVKAGRDVDSLFHRGGTSALENKINGLNDFELIDFLIIK